MDYQTVAVALVVGLGSGVVGTLISTRHARDEGERQRDHERHERMRERQINAADDFLRSAAEALGASVEFEGRSARRSTWGLRSRLASSFRATCSRG